MPTSIIITRSQGMIQAFGISAKKKFIPAERIKLVKPMSMEVICENIAYDQTFQASDRKSIPLCYR